MKTWTVLILIAILVTACGRTVVEVVPGETPTPATAAESVEPAAEGEAEAVPTIDESTLTEATALPPEMPEAGTSLIAFISALGGDFEVFVVEPGGQNLVQLTDNTAQDFAPAWSPDGTRIAFHSDRDGNEEIYVVGADGSDLQRLTSDLAADTFPAWSPDGTRLAFVSTRGGKADLWLMDMASGEVTQLSDNTFELSNLDWSPDGTRIAYTASQEGQGRVRVVPQDAPQDALDLAGDGFYPDWSPDGTLIAYAATQDGLDVFVMGADGASPTPLVQAPDQQHSPSFSPDGSQIVYVSQTGETSDLWVFNLDGSSGATQITQGMNPLMPRWSP